MLAGITMRALTILTHLLFLFLLVILTQAHWTVSNRIKFSCGMQLSKRVYPVVRTSIGPSHVFQKLRIQVNSSEFD